jgi:hypothetical protein
MKIKCIGYCLLVLSMIGCLADQDAEWRRLTLRQLEKIRSGEVKTLYDPHPEILHNLLRDAEIVENLESIAFGGYSSGIDNSSNYKALAEFPKLTSISFYCATDTNQMLRYVLLCKQVKNLSLVQSDMSSAGLTTIAEMKQLEHLSFAEWSREVAPDSFNQLSKLQNLKTLSFEDGPNEIDTNKLQSEMPSCKITVLCLNE